MTAYMSSEMVKGGMAGKDAESQRQFYLGLNRNLPYKNGDLSNDFGLGNGAMFFTASNDFDRHYE